MEELLVIGGGKKSELYALPGTRSYLGSYGFGFKAIVNIASEIAIITCSEEEGKKYSATLDLDDFDNKMAANSEGCDFEEKAKPNPASRGTILILKLKKPTTKKELDEFVKVLGNLPNDNGKFNCYCGFYSNAKNLITGFPDTFTGLSEIAKKLLDTDKVQIVSNIFDSELEECEIFTVNDKENNASGVIYFAGTQGDKPKNLKESLRGVYVRVNGRLLKSDFSSDKYTSGISKYIQFKSSMRTELSIDWLRSEITLSRNGIKFNNEQLESVFKKSVGRMITQFIKPQLEKLQKVKDKEGNKRFKQREELAKKRVSKTAEVVIKGVKSGFVFKPDTDAELAILIAQEAVMSLINPSYKLIDYNAQEPFDCMLYDESRDEYIYTELEPTLIEFLDHKNKADIQLIIVWTLGKWRIGDTQKGKEGYFKLLHPDNSPKGHYKLLQNVSEASLKPKKIF